VGWYGSAYLITNTVLQPTWGKLYVIFSLRLVFISIMALFMLGSLICAVAPNSPVFIVGRALAGLGAGGQFAGSLTIIAHSVPLHRRATYTGGLSALFGVTPFMEISHFRLPVLWVHC
jgi:MFS family permease